MSSTHASPPGNAVPAPAPAPESAPAPAPAPAPTLGTKPPPTASSLSAARRPPPAGLLYLLSNPLSSDQAALLGRFMGRALLRAWGFLPAKLRRTVHQAFDRLVARTTQSRLGLRESATFFTTSMVDREVVTIDGVSLKTTHLWPHLDDGKPHPVVLMRTPYFRKFDMPIARLMCERGFHVIIQDVRGRFESGGDASLGHAERHDAGCTLRWLSHQPWCDGRIVPTGLSMGGYTSWAAVSGVVDGLHLPGPGTQPQGKPIRIVAIFHYLSSSDIIRRGLFHDMGEHEDCIVRLDLTTKYAALMWTLQHHSHLMGSYMAWVGWAFLKWAFYASSASFQRLQTHLPLRDVDVAVIGEAPSPRTPIIPKRSDKYWQAISHDHIPALVGSGAVIGDASPAAAGGAAAEPDLPPAVLFVSGWYDIFGNDTIFDYQNAERANLLAKRQGKRGNDRLYLMMGPFSHFSAELFFPLMMRETMRVLEDVFADLGLPAHSHAPLKHKPKVTAFCMGSRGWFWHRMGYMERLTATQHWSIASELNHCWRFYDAWPPRSAADVRLALSERGRLVPVPLAGFRAVPGAASFLWDPSSPTPTLGGAMFSAMNVGPLDNAPLEARQDTLVFTTPAAANAAEFAGLVRVKTWLWSTAVSADLWVRVSLVDPRDGASISLIDGIKRHTLGQLESWPALVEVDVGHVCAAVERGWKVRITVAGGSFPQFSRNLGYGEHTDTAVRMTTAHHRVSFAEAQQFSHLLLPVVGGQDAFERAWPADT